MPPPRKQGGGKRGGKQSTAQSIIVPSSKLTLDIRESVSQGVFRPSDHYTHVEDHIPVLPEGLPLKLRGKHTNLDSGYTLVRWEPDEPEGHLGTLTVKQGTTLKQVRAYQKIIGLLDPYRWMRYKERPSEPFLWFTQTEEITAPENQAYVDVIASALVSKFGRESRLPHFCEFYGAIRAVADVFLYRLEDDLEEFRFMRWFWEAVDANEIGLRIIDKSTGRRLTLEECKELLKPDDDYLQDGSDDEDDDDDDDSSRSSEKSHGSLGAEELETPMPDHATASVSFGDYQEAELETDSEDEIQVHRRPGHTPKTASSLETASDLESQNSFCDDFTVHAEFRKMPVTIMYLEAMEDTMDSLIEQDEFAPVTTSEQEVRWGAWLFQVVAALSQLQRFCSLTHNDLHTNNILWKPTDLEFLVYRDTNGRTWKVPTFGKLFTLIDYGRSIFLLKGSWVVSSDYNEGHDADGMYNFGPIEDSEQKRVLPNKSFDLCRLSCSLLRGLFPHTPEARPGGAIITKEKDLEIHETTHPLFNSLWSWLKNDEGGNILETGSGEEKYPGFELYTVIAGTVHNAVPEQQFSRKLFELFLAKQPIPAGTPVIPLAL
jgi:hypothetical protein